MSVEDEVRAANEAFYAAFRARDFAAMDRLWARRAAPRCVHPGWDVLRGRAPVIQSWRGILGNPSAPSIEATDVDVSVIGDVAIVTCHEGERGQPTQIVATNVFVREDGAWRIAHHHAGPLADPLPPTPDPRDLN
ncbi:MAG: nuclear transport factor 2 family protein [Myxococcales bacterium]|nr:nuclear transport factor 2 family protein [Myxococcales bacterium]